MTQAEQHCYDGVVCSFSSENIQGLFTDSSNTTDAAAYPSTAVYEAPMMHMGSVIVGGTSVVEVRGGRKEKKFFPRCESRFNFRCESHKLCRFYSGIITGGTEPEITEARGKLSLSSHSDAPLTPLYSLRMN